LSRDADLRRSLGEAGRHRVEANYGVEAAFVRLRSVVEELA
jgi:hypothetical protein